MPAAALPLWAVRPTVQSSCRLHVLRLQKNPPQSRYPLRPAHAVRVIGRVCAGAGRARSESARPDAGRDRRQRQRRPAPARRNAMVRHRAAALPPAAGLGNATLRRLLAAPGPGLRTPGDTARNQQRPVRRDDRARHHGAGAHGAAVVFGGLHLLLQAGRDAGRSAPEVAADAGRLYACDAGDVAWRILRARRPARPVPDGLRPAHRLDLFGDTIETIRTFDADTQRSLYPVREVRLLPGREFPMDEAARTTFRNRWREQFEGDPSRSVVYKDISSGIASAGIEYYLPLFFEETATLFDYLPPGAALALVGDVDAAIKRFWVDTQSRYRFLKADRERPILAPEALFLGDEQFFTRAKPYARLAISKDADSVASELSAPIPNIAVNRHSDDPLANLRAYLL